jgi:hypothetical protein
MLGKKFRAYAKRRIKTNKSDPDFKKLVVHKIAVAVLQVLKGYKSYEVYGPQGICCRYTIYFKTPRKPLLVLPLEEEEGQLFVRDYTICNNRFREGSIGAINGMNHPSIPVPLDASAQWFADEISLQEKTLKKQKEKTA